MKHSCICDKFPTDRKLARCHIHGLWTKAHVPGCTCKVDRWGYIEWCVRCKVSRNKKAPR